MNFESDLFEDIGFLDDYSLEGNLGLNCPVRALIKGTHQRVIIHKVRMEEKIAQRFKTLVQLFKDGVILADSIFLVQEQNAVFVYIVSVDLQNCQRFQSLKQHLGQLSQEELTVAAKRIVSLIKLVHAKGESCLNLKIESIIVDSNNNLFLSPYILDQGAFLQTIKNEQLPYQRSHLSPQLIEQLFSKRQGRLKVGKKMLQRNDYWGFGCILLEMFVFETPPFVCVDTRDQQTIYFEMDNLLNEWVKYIPISLKGLMYNSLEKAPELRSLEDVSERSKQRLDSTLIIHLIELTHPVQRDEFQLIVHLSSKFSFYLQQKQGQQPILINKTITLSDTQKSLETLLLQPIKIVLKSRLSQSQIQINLGTLVLKQQGIRVWRQPIVSSYPIPGTKSRLKIKSEFKSPKEDPIPPSEVVQIEIVQKEVLKEKKALLNESRIIVKQLNPKSNRKGNRDNEPIGTKNLSINQIAQYIDKLKEQFTHHSQPKLLY